jgi:LemA protein
MDGYPLAAALAAAALLAVGCAWLVAHNRFVQLRQHLTESWRDVDVELKRRHDLVPGLVAVVEAAAAHEREVLRLLRGEEGLLSGPVAAVAERCPHLRSSTNFLDLQRRLVETEDRLAAARRVHTSNVERYNARCQSVPTNLVARVGGFPPASYDTPVGVGAEVSPPRS